MTTEYILLAWNQHSIFIFHYLNAELLGKYFQSPVWQLCDSCQILDLINFQNNLAWPNSEIQKNYSQVCKKLSIHLVLVLKTSQWYRFHPFYLSISPVPWHKWQIVSLSWASCTSARHAGNIDCLTTSLILITMDNGRGALCMVAVLQSSQPNQQRNKKRKIYATKQIKICAE